MNKNGHSRNALPLGTVLNDVYTVESELGHGGFGIVYRARHQDLGPVAIKEYLPVELGLRDGRSVHPVSADTREFFEAGMGRFLQEAQQLVKFRTHPGIVSCRDFFRANGTAYLVMDLEEALPLSELLRARETEGRPLTEKDLLKVVVPLLRGLASLHATGVLHRDIKPSNVLIRREDEQPVLIDFGAAKQEVAKSTKSLAPYSPGYAAIEQVADGNLGTWTDLYSVGALMWRMVAGGNRPFEPPNPVRVEKRMNAKFLRGDADPMPAARALGNGRFSDLVLDAIDRCLELRESDRMKECQELLSHLQGNGKTHSTEIGTERQQRTHLIPNTTKKNDKRRHGERIVRTFSHTQSKALPMLSSYGENERSISLPKVFEYLSTRIFASDGGKGRTYDRSGSDILPSLSSYAGTGRSYAVYEHPVFGPTAVKMGFRWPAFLFSAFWALYKKLWKLALGWFALTMVLLLVVSVATGKPSLLLWGTLSLVGGVVLGYIAAEWEEDSLRERGYKLNRTTSARTKDEAISIVSMTRRSEAVPA